MAGAHENNKWDSYNGASPLIALYNSFHPLTVEMEALIDSHTFPVSFRKNRYIISPIDRNRYLYLILKGVVRGFYKDSGTEITSWICQENEIVGTIRNLWTEEESDEYLQAIEDVELIAIPHELTTMLYKNFAEANIIGRKIMELHYRGAYNRGFICQIPSATGRYKHLLWAFPWMINRVPLRYVASFLGLRLETLSRIRSVENKRI
jgi:CRP-like cAMP-binding protein